MAKNSEEGIKVVVENRKARHDYEFLETLEAGLVLKGWEVKALREGAANIKESYVREHHGELFLVGSNFTPYRFGRREEMSETRDKKLLVHSRELKKLLEQVSQKGLTLVPVKLYFKSGRAKLLIALGKGKKFYDKRHDIKKREADREMARAYK